MLDAADRHLRDRRLHIVAAPGAGKTSLGLEVFRRLGRPALVLAPTLTIRDQWILRLEDFEPDDPASWTSTRLDEPAFFTAATYQALLGRSRRDAAADEPSREDETSLISVLKRAGVGTLILDEAHHLKRAWWRSLQRVVEEIDDLQLVSLTGTPPYDAAGVEWLRYEELCGPIDEEISVPELVKARTLCPHQDFVYAVSPSEVESASVLEHDAAVRRTLGALLDDPALQSAVDAHPWLGDDPPIERVLDDPELAIALLCYAEATGSGATATLTRVLDLRGEALPPLGRDRWELLLRAYLFGASFALSEEEEEERDDLAARLRKDGLLWRRSLRLVASPAVDRALALSAVKVEACVAIHTAERSVRGDALRQVFLFDFIRDEALELEPGAGAPELGAFPVFDRLRRPDVALLTGRLAAIHESRADDLVPDIERSSLGPLPGRPGWFRIEGVPSGVLVSVLTRLLEAGRLHVLVGTRSLLGEGWDAPVVNSVVLGSYVGAFVSTNQMRGRAIRTEPANPGKVASVWHLVAVQADTPTGRRDLEQLDGRFRTFVGLSADGSVIESGLDRLDLPPLRHPDAIHAFNEELVRRLSRLPDVASAWLRAIEGSDVGRVVPTVSFRAPPTLRALPIRRTLQYALVELGLASIFVAAGMLRDVLGGAGAAVSVGAAVSMALLAPRLWRTARLALFHAPVDGSVRQIGLAVAETLARLGLLEQPPLRVHVDRELDGTVLVSVDGGSFRDQSCFADSIGEVLGPIDNPRYLITRPRAWLGRRREDVHAVPSVFGSRKARAEAFHAAWLEHVGDGELVYTRGDDGRRLLLAARARSFVGHFEHAGDRIDRWR